MTLTAEFCSQPRPQKQQQQQQQQQIQQQNNFTTYTIPQSTAGFSRSRYASPTITPPSFNSTEKSNSISPTATSMKQNIATQRMVCHGYLPAFLRPTGYQPRQRPSTTNNIPSPDKSYYDSQSSSRTTIDLPSTPTDEHSEFTFSFDQMPRVVGDEWIVDLGDVTGIPSRKHWKPDPSAACCTSPRCRTMFNFVYRRHHCRRCGGIFCSSHTGQWVPLDQFAHFHPKGIMSKACDGCFDDFQTWKHGRNSRAGSIASGLVTPPSANPFDGIPIRASDFLGAQARATDESIFNAGSESVRDNDWNWSTF